MKRFIEETIAREYDIVVIGGGITGAAVAYDAASRGFSVALVEKQDFGHATSSATSKLIHGGFRYLANFEIAIVRESLKERRILENIAPNLVYPIRVLVPCYDSGITKHTWFFRMGMLLYDSLSFDKGNTWDPDKRIGTHEAFSAASMADMEPVIPVDGLKKVFAYYDCASLFPERLTLAFVRSAVKYGAHAANYCKVEEFIYGKGEKKIAGVKVRDTINDRLLEIRGKLTINCGGPWADLLLDTASGRAQGNAKRIKRSEGIHIITKKPVCRNMIAIVTSSGKGVVMTPWRGYTLIGPTDKEYFGDPDDYKVTKDSVIELMDTANRSLKPEDRLEFSDIVHTYGGLRPLIEDKGKSVRDASRRYEIYDNARDGLDGLITVEGGKYTTSRNLAMNVMKVVGHKLNNTGTRCITSSDYLAGCAINSVEKFICDLKKEFSDFSERTVDCLGRYYGTDARVVLKLARSDKSLSTTLDKDGEITAQVVYAIREEMAMTLRDILLRRTGLGTAGRPEDGVLNLVSAIAAEELGWSADRVNSELASVESVYGVLR